MLTRRLVIAILFTALFYILGLVPSIKIPFTPIPIMLQNMGVFLAGSIIGPLGVVSVLMLLGLTALGLPMLTGGRGGIAVFFVPTAGYLIGWVIVTLIIGLLAYKHWSHISFAKFVWINLLGMLIMHIGGILWLMWRTEMNLITAFTTNLILIPGDVTEVFLASYIANQFKKYYPIMPKREVADATYKRSRDNLRIG